MTNDNPLLNFAFDFEDKKPAVQVPSTNPLLMFEPFVNDQGIESPLPNDVASWLMEQVTLRQLPSYPPLEEICKQFGFDRKFFQDEILESLNSALKKKGWDKFSAPVVLGVGRKNQLDPFFVMAVELLIDPIDKRSRTTKLKAVGISSKRFNYLLEKEEYRKYWDKKVSVVISQTKNFGDLALARNVDNGDLQSIKYYNELTGRYRGQDETVINLMVLLGRMMEVLAKHVEPQILAVIADELDNVIDVKPKDSLVGESRQKELEVG